MKHPLDPFGRRHQPLFFRRKIDSGLMSEAQFGAVIRKAVNSQPHADVVEKNVARLEDGFVQTHDAVGTLSVNPAFELSSIECRIAWTKRGEILRRDFVFQ